ncbi:hypothetical protein FRB91_003172 [Serendipita sp. 411]|nr:hypothetical protein FRB91_003172 [Serendipita sp. 411]
MASCSSCADLKAFLPIQERQLSFPLPKISPPLFTPHILSLWLSLRSPSSSSILLYVSILLYLFTDVLTSLFPAPLFNRWLSIPSTQISDRISLATQLGLNPLKLIGMR